MTFDPMSVEVTCVTLPKDHCVQVLWRYINVCGYSDQFCKLPHTYIHILRTYYIHTTYYVQNEWSHSLLLNSVQARQQQLLNSVQARQKCAYERNSFPNWSVIFKLRQHESTPAQQIPRQKKMGNVPALDLNSRPSVCKADDQTIRPPVGTFPDFFCWGIC